VPRCRGGTRWSLNREHATRPYWPRQRRRTTPWVGARPSPPPTHPWAPTAQAPTPLTTVLLHRERNRRSDWAPDSFSARSRGQRSQFAANNTWVNRGGRYRAGSCLNRHEACSYAPTGGVSGQELTPRSTGVHRLRAPVLHAGGVCGGQVDWRPAARSDEKAEVIGVRCPGRARMRRERLSRANSFPTGSVHHAAGRLEEPRIRYRVEWKGQQESRCRSSTNAAASGGLLHTSAASGHERAA